RPVLVVVRIDAAQAIDRTLDEAEPLVCAVVHAHEIDPERLRDGEHTRAKEEDLQPAVECHWAFSEPFGPKEGVNEIDENGDRQCAGDPAFESHLPSPSSRVRSTSAERPSRSHAATYNSMS